MRANERTWDSLSKILNDMTDLEALAMEHRIENQVYEGGGLEKIMCLLREARHWKFRSQNLYSTGCKMYEWGKLFVFLKDALNLPEKSV